MIQVAPLTSQVTVFKTLSKETISLAINHQLLRMMIVMFLRTSHFMILL
jgi:hypothetical protein